MDRERVLFIGLLNGCICLTDSPRMLFPIPMSPTYESLLATPRDTLSCIDEAGEMSDETC